MNIWNHRGSGSSSSGSSWMKCEVNKLSNTFWQVGWLWDSSLISWTPPSTMSHSYWIPIECLCIFGCSLKIWRYTILLSLLYHCQEQGYTFSVVFEKDHCWPSIYFSLHFPMKLETYLYIYMINALKAQQCS